MNHPQSEYSAGKKQLLAEYESQRKALISSIAKKYNTVQLGQIIEDNVGTKLKVEKMIPTLSFETPEMIYKGTKLNKDNSVSKRQEGNYIYQSNLKK
jgi:hypothetical protein